MASVTVAGLGLPGATYRLQFHPGFTFEHASKLAGYLRDLGVTHCYASPLFQACAGSTHGYDARDFSRFSAELGGEAAFDRFAAALRDAGLGLILDIVPNHMGIGDRGNGWWQDVLEHGPASRYADHFDIDWHAPGLEGKVMLPVLGDRFGAVLEAGQLQVLWEKNRLCIGYHERRFPMSNQACRRVVELCGFAEEDMFQAPEQLAQVIQRSSRTHAALEDTLARINGIAGQPRSFDELERLLNAQHYRLAFWKIGPSALNYRRFFDIIDLAGVRVERPEVFEDVHRSALGLVARDAVHGFRVDHPDGLWDPTGYFERLREAASGSKGAPLYVVAEKILAHDEFLPEDWLVHGTTGYDFLNLLNGVFVDSEAEAPLDAFYRELADGQEDFSEVVMASKKLVMTLSLAAEINSLAPVLAELAFADRHCRDFPRDRIREALSEWIAALTVYRTYLRPERPAPSVQERRWIEKAGSTAGARCPEFQPLFHFLTGLLLEPPPPSEAPDVWRFIMRLQQLSGPVMAKGVEDTAFYRFNRYLSLNEVGGDPGQFGVRLEEFHRGNVARLQRWPQSMLATGTHDTKRSEDVRARLNVLSELPEEWIGAVREWRKLNATDTALLDSNTEYVLYQTLVGVWPAIWPGKDELSALRGRVWQALCKSVREAKRRTSWLEVNQEYEGALERFVSRLFEEGNSFLAAFRPFQERVAYFGRWNSLSQVLLKATAPGVPDFYQGCELWDLSLVDPDNRHDVDYSRAQRWLSSLRAAPDLASTAGQLVQEPADGRIKLFLTTRVLNFRREHPDLFARGDYTPVRVNGVCSQHVIAFTRRTPEQAILVVAPRWTAKLTKGRMMPPIGAEVWGDTTLELPEGVAVSKRNVFTGHAVSAAGGRIGVGELLALFPVALVG